MTEQIHNQDLHTKVEMALNNIRPFLQSDGGNIELIEVTNDFIAKVKLVGACESCKMSASTMKAGVEATVKNFVPEIVAVIAV
ncbi:MAG: NifU family protein [Chitinophagales bacterium]|nr:NifU family protein [Chitinophagales bacterium]HMV15942.1 NifU family protein [Chitinophagales bacterium]HMW13206.1 NifU family protein [Chitinophagales bacterium]HMX60908.1 NifU family protein [Chitinophagales bacterium]HMY23809.1 NifU family protein [Chitinophagales bacterium]